MAQPGGAAVEQRLRRYALGTGTITMTIIILRAGTYLYDLF